MNTQFFGQVKNQVQKAFLALTLSTSLLFLTAGPATAKVYNLDSFMSQQAKFISKCAHPTAAYTGSSHDGNGVLTIYYKGILGGNHAMRVYGSLDSSGLFDNLVVLSDSGSIAPFVAVGVLRNWLANYLEELANNADSPEKEWLLREGVDALRSGNGETMCEFFLKAASL